MLRTLFAERAAAYGTRGAGGDRRCVMTRRVIGCAQSVAGDILGQKDPCKHKRSSNEAAACEHVAHLGRRRQAERR